MPNFAFENDYPNQIIAGIDEAGRGPLAGPLVAAAVIIDRTKKISASIDDSKKLAKLKREILYEQITKDHLWSVGIIEAAEIDQINILQATIKACLVAANNLTTSPDIILVDGNMKFAEQKFISIVRGDSLSISIAAASIVAKVYRDRLMTELSLKYPEYLWDKNSGYGTKKHREAIWQYGQTIYHRKSFKWQNQ